MFCGTTPESKFMLGRPRCTTGQEFGACDRLERRARLATQEARVWRQSFWHSVGPPNVCDDPVATHPPGSTVVVGPDPPSVRRAISVGAFGALRVGSSNLFLEGGVPRAVFPVRHISRHALWECLGAVVGVPTRHIRSSTHESVCLLLAFGGLGLRSAVRTAAAAYWVSWGDSFGMIQQRHPAVARALVHELVGGQSQSVHLLAASMVAAQLASLDGFEVPSWPALAAGDRPPLRNVEDFEPGGQRGGGQHEAAAREGNSVSKI